MMRWRKRDIHGGRRAHDLPRAHGLIARVYRAGLEHDSLCNYLF